MTRDDDTSERALMERAILELKPLIEDRACMLIVGFDAPGGIKICSVSNVAPENQIDMMEILTEAYTPVPKDTTLN